MSTSSQSCICSCENKATETAGKGRTGKRAGRGALISQEGVAKCVAADLRALVIVQRRVPQRRMPRGCLFIHHLSSLALNTTKLGQGRHGKRGTVEQHPTSSEHRRTSR